MLRLFRTSQAVVVVGCFAAVSSAGSAEPLSPEKLGVMFTLAQSDGRVGTARKTKPVDVRPAQEGETVVTIINGVVETRSPPAAAGDMVVRNRCPETGNEKILVPAAKFAERYEGPVADVSDGWEEYRPRGVEMLYFIVGQSEGSFTFIAPWGETMVAEPSDAIVRDPANPSDTYRIEAQAFACTYEVVRKPAR